MTVPYEITSAATKAATNLGKIASALDRLATAQEKPRIELIIMVPNNVSPEAIAALGEALRRALKGE